MFFKKIINRILNRKSPSKESMEQCEKFCEDARERYIKEMIKSGKMIDASKIEVTTMDYSKLKAQPLNWSCCRIKK